MLGCTRRRSKGGGGEGLEGRSEQSFQISWEDARRELWVNGKEAREEGRGGRELARPERFSRLVVGRKSHRARRKS